MALDLEFLNHKSVVKFDNSRKVMFPVGDIFLVTHTLAIILIEVYYTMCFMYFISNLISYPFF